MDLGAVKAMEPRLDTTHHRVPPAQTFPNGCHIVEVEIDPNTGAVLIVVYHPRWIDPYCPNNNSTVKLFREGSFNLLSLGDVESHNISAQLTLGRRAM
jgi:hypothetical protein